jgi:hypothetical protein
LNSEPDITRRNKIFPGPENFGTRENGGKLVGVIEDHSGKSHLLQKLNLRNFKIRQMDYFSEKVGLHTLISGVSHPDNREITQLVGLLKRYHTF